MVLRMLLSATVLEVSFTLAILQTALNIKGYLDLPVRANISGDILE